MTNKTKRNNEKDNDKKIKNWNKERNIKNTVKMNGRKINGMEGGKRNNQKQKRKDLLKEQR